MVLNWCDNCEKYLEVETDEEFPQFQYCYNCYMYLIIHLIDNCRISDD